MHVDWHEIQTLRALPRILPESWQEWPWLSRSDHWWPNFGPHITLDLPKPKPQVEREQKGQNEPERGLGPVFANLWKIPRNPSIKIFEEAAFAERACLANYVWYLFSSGFRPKPPDICETPRSRRPKSHYGTINFKKGHSTEAKKKLALHSRHFSEQWLFFFFGGCILAKQTCTSKCDFCRCPVIKQLWKPCLQHTSPKPPKSKSLNHNF